MWFNPKPTDAAFGPRALDRLRRVDDMAALLASDDDAIFLPDYSADKSRPKRGWMDPFGTPYVIALRNAVFYPQHALEQRQPPPRDVPERGLGRGQLGLVVAQDGAVYPDGLGKSYLIHSCIDMPDPASRWEAALPPVRQTLTGTHLFAELFYAHFGHCLTDMPARLWPLHEGLLSLDQIDSVLGMGLLGTGRRGERLPGYAADLLRAYGAPKRRCTFAAKPVRVERLILPRRLSPYSGLMHPAFARTMRRAGDVLAQAAEPRDRPKRLFLSRSRLKDDPRAGDGMDLLDALFERKGFAVIHPQDHPLAEQAALLQGATHVAGSVGSQVHLCAFARTPGVKVLTIGPGYFKLDINEKLIADLGGEETHFLIDLPRPPGPRHRGRWDFEAAMVPELEAVIDGWV